MSTVEQKVKEFQGRSYDERFRIAMNIITNLKDRGNTQAQEIYERISTMEEIPEDILDAIYQDFCESVERVEQEKIQGELHNFDKVKAYIRKLREREGKERQAENCETLLDSIDDL